MLHTIYFNESRKELIIRILNHAKEQIVNGNFVYVEFLSWEYIPHETLINSLIDIFNNRKINNYVILLHTYELQILASCAAICNWNPYPTFSEDFNHMHYIFENHLGIKNVGSL